MFTLHLRPGHKWSDGQPFTSEDFRYYWEDVANNKDLSPFGLPQALLVDGKRAEVRGAGRDDGALHVGRAESACSCRRSRGRARFTSTVPRTTCASSTRATPASRRRTRSPTEAGSRNWAGLHQKKDEQFRFDNPDLPTLEPWINTTPLPSTRFVLVRNPYFHRVDSAGRQLPYIDRVIVGITDDKLIPAKTGAGDVDLQARYLRFDNYTFLKRRRAAQPATTCGCGRRRSARRSRSIRT